MTKQEIENLIYDMQMEVSNELDFDYESEYKQEISNNDLNMLVECIERFVNKLVLNIDNKFVDTIDYGKVNDILYYLATHNKNYNNEQYEKIIELKEMFEKKGED